MLFTGIFKRVTDGLLGIAYPAECRVCGQEVESWYDGVVCAACWENPEVTRFFDEGLCEKCGMPLEAIRQSASGQLGAAESNARGKIDTVPKARLASCPLCASFPFFRARACGSYSGGIEASILLLKTHPHLCARLRDNIKKNVEINNDLLASDLIVPVPLHRKRLRERGFNQAEIVAACVGRASKLPVDARPLVRIRHSGRHRAGLDSIDRQKSVGRAFSVARPDLVSGKAILLVDDVFTTGSTAAAASETLLSAGARSVGVFTLARVHLGAYA